MIGRHVGGHVGQEGGEVQHRIGHDSDEHGRRNGGRKQPEPPGRACPRIIGADRQDQQRRHDHQHRVIFDRRRQADEDQAGDQRPHPPGLGETERGQGGHHHRQCHRPIGGDIGGMLDMERQDRQGKGRQAGPEGRHHSPCQHIRHRDRQRAQQHRDIAVPQIEAGMRNRPVPAMRRIDRRDDVIDRIELIRRGFQRRQRLRIGERHTGQMQIIEAVDDGVDVDQQRPVAKEMRVPVAGLHDPQRMGGDLRLVPVIDIGQARMRLHRPQQERQGQDQSQGDGALHRRSLRQEISVSSWAPNGFSQSEGCCPKSRAPAIPPLRGGRDGQEA